MKIQNQPATKQDLLELEERLEKRFEERFTTIRKDLANDVADIVNAATTQILNVMADRFDKVDRRFDRIEKRLHEHDLNFDDHEVRLRHLEAYRYGSTGSG